MAGLVQISRPVLGPGAYAVEKTTMRTPVDARPSARTPDRSTAKPIDFSDVAPTRLQALDLMHASGQPDAARGGGSKPLVAFYTGLTDRMKLMEAQGLPISVVA